MSLHTLLTLFVLLPVCISATSGGQCAALASSFPRLYELTGSFTIAGKGVTLSPCGVLPSSTCGSSATVCLGQSMLGSVNGAKATREDTEAKIVMGSGTYESSCVGNNRAIIDISCNHFINTPVFQLTKVDNCNYFIAGSSVHACPPNPPPSPPPPPPPPPVRRLVWLCYFNVWFCGAYERPDPEL